MCKDDGNVHFHITSSGIVVPEIFIDPGQDVYWFK
jgi:hypothetical protein